MPEYSEPASCVILRMFVDDSWSSRLSTTARWEGGRGGSREREESLRAWGESREGKGEVEEGE